MSPYVLMHVFYSHKYSFKLRRCILFNCMFQNFSEEIMPETTGNEYRNMQMVIFERLCVIVVCL
jgi:hypothetical protein